MVKSFLDENGEDARFITKGMAAREVYKELRITTLAAFFGIIAVVITLLLPKMLKFYVALIPISAAAFLIRYSILRMNKLNKKYRLGYSHITWNGYNPLDWRKEDGGSE